MRAVMLDAPHDSNPYSYDAQHAKRNQQQVPGTSRPRLVGPLLVLAQLPVFHGCVCFLYFFSGVKLRLSLHLSPCPPKPLAARL